MTMGMSGNGLDDGDISVLGPPTFSNLSETGSQQAAAIVLCGAALAQLDAAGRNSQPHELGAIGCALRAGISIEMVDGEIPVPDGCSL